MACLQCRKGEGNPPGIGTAICMTVIATPFPVEKVRGARRGLERAAAPSHTPTYNVEKVSGARPGLERHQVCPESLPQICRKDEASPSGIGTKYDPAMDQS